MRNRLNGLAMLLVLLACASTRADEPGVYSDNIVVVLDASGSMNARFSASPETKMDAAKSALKQVLLQAPQSAQIGVLVFSARNLRDDWIYPLGPRDDAKLSAAIAEPLAGSSTPLGHYLKKGADRLLQQRERQYGYGSYRLLVVTDGQADDPQLVEVYSADIIARGICVDVIGVDMAGDHLLAHRVHSYRRADDEASLTRAISEVFAEISEKSSDAAKSEDFALLAALPADMAAPILNALSVSGNQPIGTKGAPRPRPVALPVQAPSAEKTAAQTAAKEKSEGSAWTIVIVSLVVINVVVGLLKRKSSL